MNLPLKSEIRDLIRPLRSMINPEYRQKAGQAAADLFMQSPLFQNHQHIACYLALPREMDSQPLIQALQQTAKACYLPVVSSDINDKTLDFALYQPDSELRPNRFKILEPQQRSVIRKAADLDLVFAPLLAFDKQGNRLGMGGGFYDYTFSFLLQGQRTKPLLIGLAYELQQVEALPREAFDVPLDGVLTEERLWMFE